MKKHLTNKLTIFLLTGTITALAFYGTSYIISLRYLTHITCQAIPTSPFFSNGLLHLSCTMGIGVYLLPGIIGLLLGAIFIPVFRSAQIQRPLLVTTAAACTSYGISNLLFILPELHIISVLAFCAVGFLSFLLAHAIINLWRVKLIYKIIILVIIIGVLSLACGLLDLMLARILTGYEFAGR